MEQGIDVHETSLLDQRKRPSEVELMEIEFPDLKRPQEKKPKREHNHFVANSREDLFLQRATYSKVD